MTTPTPDACTCDHAPPHHELTGCGQSSPGSGGDKDCRCLASYVVARDGLLVTDRPEPTPDACTCDHAPNLHSPDGCVYSRHGAPECRCLATYAVASRPEVCGPDGCTVADHVDDSQCGDAPTPTPDACTCDHDPNLHAPAGCTSGTESLYRIVAAAHCPCLATYSVASRRDERCDPDGCDVADHAGGGRCALTTELTTIAVIFDGPPGQTPGRFVEVELPDTGESVGVGRWVDEHNGRWHLELEVPSSTVTRNEGASMTMTTRPERYVNNTHVGGTHDYVGKKLNDALDLLDEAEAKLESRSNLMNVQHLSTALGAVAGALQQGSDVGQARRLLESFDHLNHLKGVASGMVDA